MTTMSTPYLLSHEAAMAIDRLLDKIAENPTLFFGMEDTCQDEWQNARNALDAVMPALGKSA
jgi:hypothetical protein